MNGILSLGRWLFPIPFLVFGAFHFMNADAMAGMTPGGSVALVYISGAGLVLAAISMFIGKFDKLASILLAVLMLLMIVLIHAPGAAKGDQMAVSSLLKDIGLMAGAMMYALGFAKDKSVVG